MYTIYNNTDSFSHTIGKCVAYGTQFSDIASVQKVVPFLAGSKHVIVYLFEIIEDDNIS